MGLLKAAADLTVSWLRRRDKNAQLKAALRQSCARKQAELDNAYRQLVAGQLLRPVQIEALVKNERTHDGVIRLGEAWLYPAKDLQDLLDRKGIYDPDLGLPLPPSFPPSLSSWEGYLQVFLESGGHQCFAVIPLPPVPWGEPRGQAAFLKRLAHQAGQPWRKKKEQELLQPFQEPHPQLGKRAWSIQTDEETTSQADEETTSAGALTHFVIVALKQGFPVSVEDQQRALRWVHRIVRDGSGLWPVDSDRRRQYMKEIPVRVFQVLKERFDLPAMACTLQDYIKQTARGIVLALEREHAPLRIPDPWIDPASGEQMYPDAWVAQDCGVTVRIVAWWRKKRGITRQGLSATQLITFRQERELKRQREQLQLTGEALGLDKRAVKKAIQRGVKEGLSEDIIKVTLKRNAAKQKLREAGVRTPEETSEGDASANTCSSLKECLSVLARHIADLQERLSEATTRDEQETIEEDLEKARGYLQQLHEGSDT